jgi:hypothetical protein
VHDGSVQRCDMGRLVDMVGVFIELRTGHKSANTRMRFGK